VGENQRTDLLWQRCSQHTRNRGEINRAHLFDAFVNLWRISRTITISWSNRMKKACVDICHAIVLELPLVAIQNPIASACPQKPHEIQFSRAISHSHYVCSPDTRCKDNIYTVGFRDTLEVGMCAWLGVWDLSSDPKSFAASLTISG
jgi:hypothetical protein